MLKDKFTQTEFLKIAIGTSLSHTLNSKLWLLSRSLEDWIKAIKHSCQDNFYWTSISLLSKISVKNK